MTTSPFPTPSCPTGPAPSPAALLGRWRAEAGLYRFRGQDGLATLAESFALELEGALSAVGGELLTLQDAAAETGYSTDHLRRLLRQGKLANSGTDTSPRMARRDLPRKPRVAEDAARLQLLPASPSQLVRALQQEHRQ